MTVAKQDKQDHKQKVIDMLSKYETAMMVTHNKQGGLVSRPMTAQQTEFDGDVWFFVSSDADVIDEIEANAEVNIAYSKNDEVFLSVSGTASMVDDDAKKKELWYPELKKWFDGAGPESSKVRLIKVKVSTATYWDSSNAESAKEGESPIENATVRY